MLDFTRLTGPDLAKVLNKLPGKDATSLVRTNRYMYEMSLYWQTSIKFRKTSIIVYCDTDQVTFCTKGRPGTFFFPDPEDEGHFYVEELIIGVASNFVNLLDIPNHLPWNIHCRRLVIRTYHPFMLPLDSIQLEFLYAHFGARDLQLDLVTVFGEFCIKPTIGHLSYFVMQEEQIVELVDKFPYAPCLYLDFAGLPMSQILKTVVSLWVSGRMPFQRWIRMRLYRDTPTDLDRDLVLQECVDFLTFFNQHCIYTKKLPVEDELPIQTVYRIIVPKGNGDAGIVLFSEPNKTPTLMGRRESICDFFPNYHWSNKYNPRIFDPIGEGISGVIPY